MMMKGETDFELPLQVFVQRTEQKILRGSLERSFTLTLEQFKQEDFVCGFDLVTDCLWPIILNVFDT